MIDFDVKDYYKTYEDNFTVLSKNIYRYIGSIELDAPYYIVRRDKSKNNTKPFTLYDVKKQQLPKNHKFVQWFLKRDIARLNKDFDEVASYSETNMLGQWDGNNFIVTDIETTSRLSFEVPRDFKADNFYYIWEFPQFGADVDFNDEAMIDILSNITDQVCNYNPYSKLLYDDWSKVPAKGVVWRRSGETVGPKYWFRTTKTTIDVAVEAAIMSIPDTSWSLDEKFEYAKKNYALPVHIQEDAFTELLKEELET